MEPLEIDPVRFRGRLDVLSKAWTWPFDLILLITGSTQIDAVQVQPKSLVMQLWLFGLEFPELAVALHRNGVAVLFTSAKKLEVLQQLQASEAVTLARTKSVRGFDVSQLPEFERALRGDRIPAGSLLRIGIVLGEQPSGGFAGELVAALSGLSCVELVECGKELSSVLLAKDAVDLASVRKAAVFAQDLMEHLVRRVEMLLDAEEQSTKERVCEEISSLCVKEEMVKKWREELNLEPEEADLVYIALQCGAGFDLSPGGARAQSDAIPMDGAFVLSVGVKYAEFSACISRTVLVDVPGKNGYTLALAVFELVVRHLTLGTRFQDVYVAARDYVQNQRPTLAGRFSTNVGWSMGLETQDPDAILNESCQQIIEPGCVFCVSVAFNTGHTDDDWLPGTAAIWLADTVEIPLNSEGSAAVVLTGKATKRAEDMLYIVETPLDTAPVTSTQSTLPVVLPTHTQDTVTQPTKQPKPPLPKEQAKGQAKGKAKSKANAHTSPAKMAVPPPPKVANVAPPKEESRPKRAQTPPPKAAQGRLATPSVTNRRQTRLRNVQTMEDQRELAQLEERQSLLRAKKQQELRDRFVGKAVQEGGVGVRKLWHYRAYKNPHEIPATAMNRVQLDMGREALLVPMGGCIVPFHVRNVKNLARSTVDAWEVLRINFFTPGQGRTLDDYPDTDDNRCYIRELTCKSRSSENFNAIAAAVREMQRNQKQSDLEGMVHGRSGAADVTEALVPLKNYHVLRDLNMRPTMNEAGGRRTTVTLEAHQNGFRASVRAREQKVDILYSQVKHAIFEPCNGKTLAIILHLHLFAPIMIGKKKTQDVQFFTEVRAQTEDLSQIRAGSAYDPDEILEEQRERDMTDRLNTCFKEFASRVESIESCKLRFDMPAFSLAFNGVPHKASVTLLPCRGCIVQLQDWPPFVLSMDEVELVVFERVTNVSLREFDIVFVKTNYNESPVRICTVPRVSLNGLKRWLADQEKVWYELGMNLTWQAMMKDIQKDPETFVNKGGWNNVFQFALEASGEENASEEHSAASDFKDESEDDDDDEDDDFDADMDDAEEDNDESSDDEDGMSWDALEEKTINDEKRQSAKKAEAAKGPPAKRARR